MLRLLLSGTTGCMECLREVETFAGVAGSGRETTTALEPTKPSEARRSRPTAEKVRDFLTPKNLFSD